MSYPQNESGIEALRKSVDNSDTNNYKVRVTGNVTVDSVLPSGQEYLFEFQDAPAVAVGVETLVFTKTVTETKYFVDKIEVSGDNKAIYNIYLDSTLINRKRTYFTYLNDVFNFGALELITGQTIEVKVEHDGPNPADFNATLIGLKIL